MADGQAAVSRISGVPDPLIGRSINDRFKIVALIARGGMGKVYRAEQATLGRVCAVKVLNPAYSGEHDPEFHKRFFLEASIASKLTHPNTVTIFDYGRTDDEVYYMAMEFLDGITLHRAIREAGSFPEERVAHISRQVCRALREAHSLGVIHRDLKPANIFLVEHGDETDFVKVLDFGLVKNVGVDAKPEEQLTQTGLFMGSPKYMAPEQIRGDKVDARTDIYSLGIIMYEMLTGKVPFDRANSLNILMAQVNEAPPPIQVMNPGAQASPRMEELVARCMAKEPKDRFASMNDVLVALKQLTGLSAAGTGEFRIGATASGPHAQVDSGQHMVASESRPHRASHPPSLSPAPMYGPASSGNVPVPLVMPRPDGDSGATPPILTMPMRRSRGKLAAGMAGAFALTALVTVAAMRASSTASHEGAAGQTEPASPTAPLAPIVDTPATQPAPSFAKVRLVSDPSGASVKEDGKELCASTPCDHDFDGDPSREHKLTFTRPGFRPETKIVHVADSPVIVRLAKATWSPPPSRPQAQPQEKDTAPTPQGFKDIPY
jgi:serine/threonine protein kinase